MAALWGFAHLCFNTVVASCFTFFQKKLKPLVARRNKSLWFAASGTTNEIREVKKNR